MNPILRNKRSLILYSVIWVIIGVTHFTFLHFEVDIPTNVAVTDSITHSLSFYLIGIIIWYIVKYNTLKSQSLIGLTLTHIISASILVTTWVLINKNIILFFYTDESIIFQYDESYLFRFIIGIFQYLALILVYYTINYNDKIKERIKSESRLNELLKESELNSLKTQINPHFLFNSLNSISSLTITEPKKAHEMIIKLSDFLRYSLRNSKKQLTTVKEEIDNCMLYISIEKIRFGDKLNFICNISEDSYLYQIPSLIIQPLLENSIKHGVSKSTELTDVILNITQNKEHLLISIENQYDTTWSVKAKGTATGLKNINQRLFHIYNTPDLIKLSNKNGIFKVAIVIPKERSK